MRMLARAVHATAAVLAHARSITLIIQRHAAAIRAERLQAQPASRPAVKFLRHLAALVALHGVFFDHGSPVFLFFFPPRIFLNPPLDFPELVRERHMPRRRVAGPGLGGLIFLAVVEVNAGGLTGHVHSLPWALRTAAVTTSPSMVCVEPSA